MLRNRVFMELLFGWRCSPWAPCDSIYNLFYNVLCSLVTLLLNILNLSLFIAKPTPIPREKNNMNTSNVRCLTWMNINFEIHIYFKILQNKNVEDMKKVFLLPFSCCLSLWIQCCQKK